MAFHSTSWLSNGILNTLARDYKYMQAFWPFIVCFRYYYSHNLKLNKTSWIRIKEIYQATSWVRVTMLYKDILLHLERIA